MSLTARPTPGARDVPGLLVPGRQTEEAPQGPRRPDNVFPSPIYAHFPEVLPDKRDLTAESSQGGMWSWSGWELPFS